MKTNILFVCLGNICRSPAADGIMHHIVEERGLSGRIGIDSAGTYAGHTGELPDARMRRAAARRGYDLGHRARQIREEDFDRFDMIVVMDDMNYENVHRLAPSRRAAEKIFRMREFFRRHPRWDHVPDPYYEGAEGFERHAGGRLRGNSRIPRKSAVTCRKKAIRRRPVPGLLFSQRLAEAAVSRPRLRSRVRN